MLWNISFPQTPQFGFVKFHFSLRYISSLSILSSLWKLGEGLFASMLKIWRGCWSAWCVYWRTSGASLLETNGPLGRSDLDQLCFHCLLRLVFCISDFSLLCYCILGFFLFPQVTSLNSDYSVCTLLAIWQHAAFLHKQLAALLMPCWSIVNEPTQKVFCLFTLLGTSMHGKAHLSSLHQRQIAFPPSQLLFLSTPFFSRGRFSLKIYQGFCSASASSARIPSVSSSDSSDDLFALEYQAELQISLSTYSLSSPRIKQSGSQQAHAKWSSSLRQGVCGGT